MTKQCEITGINPGLLRKAKQHWRAERKRHSLGYKALDAGLLSDGNIGYVASLPPYPTDPDDLHCMPNWYNCYMEASYLDTYREMDANIQQQMTYGEINLTAYLDSYAACIGGNQT
jgi:hypothetical protein